MGLPEPRKADKGIVPRFLCALAKHFGTKDELLTLRMLRGQQRKK
jgi:hypothetical protein